MLQSICDATDGIINIYQERQLHTPVLTRHPTPTVRASSEGFAHLSDPATQS